MPAAPRVSMTPASSGRDRTTTLRRFVRLVRSGMASKRGRPRWSEALSTIWIGLPLTSLSLIECIAPKR